MKFLKYGLLMLGMVAGSTLFCSDGKDDNIIINDNFDPKTEKEKLLDIIKKNMVIIGKALEKPVGIGMGVGAVLGGGANAFDYVKWQKELTAARDEKRKELQELLKKERLLLSEVNQKNSGVYAFVKSYMQNDSKDAQQKESKYLEVKRDIDTIRQEIVELDKNIFEGKDYVIQGAKKILSPKNIVFGIAEGGSVGAVACVVTGVAPRVVSAFVKYSRNI